MSEISSRLALLKTVLEGLPFIDRDQLPPSFAEEVLPQLEDTAWLATLETTLVYADLLRFSADLAAVAEERAWYFWEKMAARCVDLFRAEVAAFYRMGSGGLLHKIHPLEIEEDHEDVHWPRDRAGDLVFLETESHAQAAFIKIGAQNAFPIVLELKTVHATPPMNRTMLAQLLEYGQALYSLLEPRCPTKVPENVTVTAGAGAKQNGDILGEDPGFLKSLERLEQAAQSEASVYLKGESGTGKELFAKHLHDLSPRAGGPFVPINCSAIPHELIESEMFGHEKGAFTGAYYRKIGRVEQANGGTLFLDEIGEMPLPFQAKLLRYLQEKKFTRVGGNNDYFSDARIVVATHRNLKAMVDEKTFREDLYFRVHVIPIEIPPLRDRGSDIRRLSELLFDKYITKSRASRRKVDETVFDALERYHFPGNVRELDNIIQHTVVMAQKSVISAEDLPEEIFKSGDEPAAQFRLHPFEKFDHLVPSDRDTLKDLKKSVEQVGFSYQRDLDRRFLLHMLEQNGGSARKAAEAASINRTLFYKLLKRAGLDIALLNRGDA